MESPFKEINYERENSIFHKSYAEGYNKGLQDGALNIMRYFCKLSNEEILNHIDYYRDFYCRGK